MFDAAPSEIFDTGIPLPVEDDAELDDAEATVLRMRDEALEWREEHLDPELKKATDYYNAQPYGNEEEGRSKVVTSEVSDVVNAILPSLMRVFFGSERVVEFKPRGPEDGPFAKQCTEYVNYIIQEDNPGFLTIYGALKDALIRKMGIVKAWWEERVHIEGSEHTGMSQEQVDTLLEDESIEVDILGQNADGTLDIAVLRRGADRGRVRIAAVPPEEFIFSPSARSLEDARIVGHVREVPADELVAMGVPEDIVDAAKGGARRDSATDLLHASRSIDGGARTAFEDEQDDATRPVRFSELYVRLDMDDDGIAELRKILLVGDEFWQNEVVDGLPFALFMPDPEPHTLVGRSLADYVMDLQRINSAIMRGMLDSLATTLDPVTEVVESQVNMKDVLSQERGRIVRVRQPGMMREVGHTFVGAAALQVLQHMEGVKEDRTGISKAAAGLDADALQSSTKAAVAATINAAQQRVELFARIFAETGMTDLMRIVLRLVVQHQDEERVVRLRNEFVRVDPRHWDAEMDVIVNVALGTGLVEEKLQMLAIIAEKQEQLLATGAPLVSFTQLRSTYARMVELAGFRNSDEFFKPWGEQEEMQLQQAKAAAQEPSEIQALLQVEMAKINARQMEKQMEMQVRVAELELERERLVQEISIKAAEVQRKTNVDVNDAAMEAERLQIEKNTSSIGNLQKLSSTKVGE